MTTAFGPPSAAKIRFATAEWCAALKDAINANTAYRAAAKDWTHGPVAIVVTAEPSVGIPEDLGMWLEVVSGECRDCRLISRAEADRASFVLVAPYSRWKEVIKKLLDPTKGMMQNKLKLTKGHMPTMVKFVTANKELVESITRVPTEFVDE